MIYFFFFFLAVLGFTLVGVTVRQRCDSGEKCSRAIFAPLDYGDLRLCCIPVQTIPPGHRANGNETQFSEPKPTAKRTYIVFPLYLKTQQYTVFDISKTTKNNDHPMRSTGIYSRDIPASLLLLWHPPCHLIIILFSSSHCSFIHFHPIAFSFLSTPRGGISTMVFASLLSILFYPCLHLFHLFTLCIHNLTQASHHMHHPSFSPCCQLVCVYKIMSFLSICWLYLSTLCSQRRALLCTSRLVLTWLCAPSGQYECRAVRLYSKTIMIPTAKYNSRWEIDRQIDTVWFIHLIAAFLSPEQAIRANTFKRAVHESKNETAGSWCNKLTTAELMKTSFFF